MAQAKTIFWPGLSQLCQIRSKVVSHLSNLLLRCGAFQPRPSVFLLLPVGRVFRHQVLALVCQSPAAVSGRSPKIEGVPLSSEFGTHKTVKARFWPWPQPFCVRKSLKFSKLFPRRSTGDPALLVCQHSVKIGLPLSSHW